MLRAVAGGGVVAMAGCGRSPGTNPGLMILAAASLQGALDEALALRPSAGAAPIVSYAGTSALARQILAGAPADLFISADRPWMEALEARNLIRPGSRADLVANRLVLVAPVRSRIALDPAEAGALVAALGEGRLAMADPDAVPAGRYGKASLAALNVWPSVAERIAPTESVRAALALVERGAAPLGIVYATDAAASAGVRVVAAFPPDTHPAIVYPLAIMAASQHPESSPVRAHLLSRAAAEVFERHGFTAVVR